MLPKTPLYVICDADTCVRSGWTLVDFARACLDGGALLLQVRAKQASGRTFLSDVTAIVALARPANALIIVNDRVDVARLGDAGGVHVGQDDLAPQAVRDMVTTMPFAVGLSTHSEGQLTAALSEPIDYVAMGPIFPTGTKTTGYDPRGLAMVRVSATRAAARGIPLVAIGGITLERAPSVIEAGAQSVAVISDLLASGDPSARVGEFLRALS